MLLHSTIVLIHSTIVLLHSTIVLIHSTIVLLHSTIVLLHSTIMLRMFGCVHELAVKSRKLGSVYSSVARVLFRNHRAETHNMLLGLRLKALLSRFSTWRICSRKQAKSECDWLVMSSVFVTSQSSCFFLCSREQIRLVENRLYTVQFFMQLATQFYTLRDVN